MHHYTKLSPLPPAAINCQRAGTGDPLRLHARTLTGMFCAGNHSCSCSWVQRPYHIQWTLSLVLLHLWLLHSFYSLGLIFKPCMLAVLAGLEYMFTASLTPNRYSRRYLLASKFKHKNPHPTSSSKPSILATSQFQGLFSSNWLP